MSDGHPQRWSPHPEHRDEDPGKSYVGDDGEVLDANSIGRVVGVGAICGLRKRDSDDDGRSQSFWVSEFAALANGRCVILHDARGFTTSAPMGVGADGAVQSAMTRDDVIDTTLTVVLPDPEDGEDHPWAWLAILARARGLDVTAEDLLGLPYDVVLTDGLTQWLDAS